MKYAMFFLCLLALAGCKSQEFFLGTYTDGESEGIYKYALKRNGSLEVLGLVAKAENPSFLAMDAPRKLLVAVNEIDQEGTGTVESYRIEGDRLVLINRSPSGGAHPCFVAVNAAGFVLAANYSGGNVGLLRLDDAGKLSPVLDLQQHQGKGHTERQEGPHAHSAWFVPASDEVISVDLGTNQLWFSTLDAAQQKLRPAQPQTLTLPKGAGPRHLTFHPNGKWIYVINELDATVSQLERSENGTFVPVSRISTLPTDFKGANLCADIHISSDGRFVYASNRGHNSIVSYAVQEDGSLRLLDHQSTMGDWPRNFSLSPDERFLLVANQRSNNLVSFKRDPKTGKLEFVGEIAAPSPVCILFASTK